jgi:diguanylate cyclase
MPIFTKMGEAFQFANFLALTPVLKIFMQKLMHQIRSLFRPRDPRRRALLWAVIASFLCGAIELGAPVEVFLQAMRNQVFQSKASGKIVVVGVDDKTLKALGTKTPDSQFFADAVHNIREAGASKILLDFNRSIYGGTQGDKAFVRELHDSHGKAFLIVRWGTNPATGKNDWLFPAREFREQSRLASAAVKLDFMAIVRRLNYADQPAGAAIPSLAAEMANRAEPLGADFPINYSINARSIPSVSALDLVQGKAGTRLVGKTVILAATARTLNDIFRSPGTEDIPGVYVQVLGAETLLQGKPISLGWIPALFVALVLALAALRANRAHIGRFVSFAALAVFIVTAVLERQLIFIEIAPSLLLFAIVGFGQLLVNSSQRGARTNQTSGLPNLAALNNLADTKGQTMIVALVRNYAAILSSMDSRLEAEFIAQLATRLSIGTAGTPLYQTEEGVFAWLVPAYVARDLGSQLDAMHAVFLPPVHSGGRNFDIDVAFGVDQNFDRTLANRYGSARLVAAEAAKEGRKWKGYDAVNLEDAEWKLSILGRLDEAIDNGELWVAYQPQLHFGSGKLASAEALVRWSHPERGEISPDDFVLVAEEHNRIGKLTDFVLERAVADAARINATGTPFSVSVNVSARLLNSPELVIKIRSLLQAHDLAPHYLALELTESAELNQEDDSLKRLHELRELGIGLSIDDYGTGFSSMDYLKLVPANEVKLDRSFVKQLLGSVSDRLIVESAIRLSHALNRSVVAEGIEDEATLGMVKDMGCDLAQGYIISPPINIAQLLSLLGTTKRRAAA